MHLLLSILADGEEQARRLLGELPPADDDEQLLGRGPAAECCRGVAGQLLCTFRKANAIAKAIEAAGSDSPRSADEGGGAGMAGRDAAQAQERQGQGVCKRRCVHVVGHTRCTFTAYGIAELASYSSQ